MTVQFETHHVGSVPLLLAAPLERPGPLPTVLWFHGLGVSKETHTSELRRLAEAGLLAVGVDAAGHGERRLSDFEARFAGPRSEIEPSLFELVNQTAEEVPRVLDVLCERGLAHPRGLAVAGISMGGYIAYRTVVIEPRLRAAVSLLGSPRWNHPASPHLYLSQFFPAALLSITAENDESVPPEAACDLHRELASRYQSRPELLRYLELQGADHLMDESSWSTAMNETVGWLVEHTMIA